MAQSSRVSLHSYTRDTDNYRRKGRKREVTAQGMGMMRYGVGARFHQDAVEGGLMILSLLDQQIRPLALATQIAGTQPAMQTRATNDA